MQGPFSRALPVGLSFPPSTAMRPIHLECPQCHEITAGDEALYGQPVAGWKCQATMLAPATPLGTEPTTAREGVNPTEFMQSA